MAIPLNTFKTKTANLTTTTSTIYTTPANTTTIVLLSQIANVGGSTVQVTANHFDGNVGTTELVKNFSIPTADSASVLTGKLVLQAGESFTANASANNAAKIILSIIETI